MMTISIWAPLRQRCPHARRGLFRRRHRKSFPVLLRPTARGTHGPVTLLSLNAKLSAPTARPSARRRKVQPPVDPVTLNRSRKGSHCSCKILNPVSSLGAEKESTKGDGSCKRNRTSSSAVGAGSSVLRPFDVVKPSGADGEVTLADINEWMLRPPARPVRHPVGEFACAPRVSGKTVAGFTRLRTAGRGTVTVVRTRGSTNGTSVLLSDADSVLGGSAS
jgi:hypothetical protein